MTNTAREHLIASILIDLANRDANDLAQHARVHEGLHNTMIQLRAQLYGAAVELAHHQKRQHVTLADFKGASDSFIEYHAMDLAKALLTDA